ncbi:hypothetical protein ACFFX0_25715 [Citricoccus parietis]|uniref:Uncharacterized protein n=1 Tax=Citricoccus parietis TaxID=592307 RepID=A0ABV5G630_9MICC
MDQQRGQAHGRRRAARAALQLHRCLQKGPRAARARPYAGDSHGR